MRSAAAHLLASLQAADTRAEHAAYLPQVTPADTICLHLGYPDPRAFPSEGLGRAAEAVFRDEPGAGLQYCEEAGDHGLRATLASMAGGDADSYLITQGTTEAIECAIRLFVRPGDVLIVEAPTYLWAIRVFKYAGARMIGVPVDHEGMRTDDLERTLTDLRDQRQQAKFIYTIPDSQNPSGASMSLDRRRQLLRLASEFGVAVFEDNPYHDLTYVTSPPPTLRALDETGVVVSARSFSKVLGPGVRLGWMEGHPDLMHGLVRMKQTGSCTLLSRIVDRFIRDGDYPAAIAEGRRIYTQKHAAMCDALARFVPDSVKWTVPAGGFYFWLRVPDTLDVDRLFRLSAAGGTLFLKGDDFFSGTPHERAIRLSLSYESPERISEGVSRLGALLAEQC